jgi:hypothetical protein
MKPYQVGTPSPRGEGHSVETPREVEISLVAEVLSNERRSAISEASLSPRGQALDRL